MFQSLKDYFRLKTGIKKNEEDLKLLTRKLDNRYGFLTAYMALTWPTRLELDPEVLDRVRHRVSSENGSGNFNAVLHKNDMMFASQVHRHRHNPEEAVYNYFHIGESTAKNLKKLAEEAQIRPKTILDFGSGYGRVSRFLPQYFPAAEIEVSEIKEQALKFQAEEFGYKTIHHSNSPESFPEKKYDLIMALSVFSHLPQQSLENWLHQLLGNLNDGGTLVFTFNDLAAESSQEILKRHGVADNGSFAYIPHSEDTHFSFVADSIKSGADYGSTFVSHQYLENLVKPSCTDFRFLGRKLVKSQDAFLVKK